MSLPLGDGGVDRLDGRHGVPQVEFDELLAAQDGRCAICGAADPRTPRP
jgi:hypothetical protein